MAARSAAGGRAAAEWGIPGDSPQQPSAALQNPAFNR